MFSLYQDIKLPCPNSENVERNIFVLKNRAKRRISSSSSFECMNPAFNAPWANSLVLGLGSNPLLLVFMPCVVSLHSQTVGQQQQQG